MGYKRQLYVFQAIDAPQVGDCTVTPIPATGQPKLQIIAQTKRDTLRLHAYNNVNNYFGIYYRMPTTPLGQETLVFISSTALEMPECYIPRGAIVSVGAIDSNSNFTTGNFSIQLYGDSGD